MRSLYLCLAASSLLWSIAAAGAFAQDAGAESGLAPELEEIRQAWQERQDRFETFEIEWEELVTTMKGTLPSQDGKPFPPEDTTHAIAHAMFANDRRFYHSRKGMQYQMDLGKFVEVTRIYSFDGEKETSLSLNPATGPHPSAFVSYRFKYGGGKDEHVVAPIASFLPLNSSLSGIDLKRCQLREEQVMLDDVSCRVLVPSTSKLLTTYWLAEDDWRIVRQLKSFGGRVFSQLTIDYEPHEDLGRIVSAWKHVSSHHATGALQRTLSARLTRLEVNAPLPSRRFEIELPRGTVVTGPGDELAVVRDNGTLRPITEGEIAVGISYEEMLATDPPPEAYRQEAWDVRLIVIASLSVVLAGAIWARHRGWS